jgi:hypothetical protein
MRDETVRLFSFCLVLGAVALIAAAEFFGDINSKYAIGLVVLLAGTGFARPAWLRQLVDHAASRWELHNESFYLATMTVLVGLSLWAIVWTILLANGLVTEMPFGKVGWVASIAVSATMSFLFFPWETLRRVYLYCERRAKRYGTLPRVWYKAISTGTVGGVIAVVLASLLLNLPIYADIFALAIGGGILIAFFAMPSPDWRAGLDRLSERFAARPWRPDIKKDAWAAVSEQVKTLVASEVQALLAAQARAITLLQADIAALRNHVMQQATQEQRHAAASKTFQDRLDRVEANLQPLIESIVEDFSKRPEKQYRALLGGKDIAKAIAENLSKGNIKGLNDGPRDGPKS